MVGVSNFTEDPELDTDLKSPFDTESEFEWDEKGPEFEHQMLAEDIDGEGEGLPEDDEEAYFLEHESQDALFLHPRHLGAPFAPDPPRGSFYPVQSTHPRGGEVNYQAEDGRGVGGNALRRFGARRGNGKRRHVGIDLYARKGDPVVACEDGRIVAFYGFCCGKNKTSYALLVDHGSVVINYGEVDPASLRQLNLAKRSPVSAGQRIAFVGVNPGGSSMLHFETYASDTTRNQRWLAGKPPPSGILDPTRYLLQLIPAAQTPLAAVTAMSGRRTLKHGSRGDDVSTLQAALVAVGFLVAIDGVFGSRTADAVRAFQSARGLVTDGVVGSRTWAALDISGGEAALDLDEAEAWSDLEDMAARLDDGRKHHPEDYFLLDESSIYGLHDEESERERGERRAVAPIDVGRAIARNKHWGARLHWQQHFDRIVTLVGFSDMTPDQATFAEAVARWQAERRLAADGIIGPNTWAAMRPLIGLIGTGTSPTPSSPPIRPGRLRNSRWLRNAWRSFYCNDSAMVRMSILGYGSPVNPLTQNAWRALDRALTDTGYVAEKTWNYNCRTIKGSSKPSLHAFGLALDIDPRCHPFLVTPDSRPVRFAVGATKTERCAEVRAGSADTAFTPEQIEAVEEIRTVAGLRVFAWGGRWRSVKDGMHFQINVSPAELSVGISAYRRI